MHHAGVVHFSVAPALGDFLSQIRQPNTRTVALKKCAAMQSAPQSRSGTVCNVGTGHRSRER